MCNGITKINGKQEFYNDLVHFCRGSFDIYDRLTEESAQVKNLKKLRYSITEKNAIIEKSMKN
tara:strand:+ start:284 stop:472 length:189 start_codon:yes stop_codon:yes gene_type:complete